MSTPGEPSLASRLEELAERAQPSPDSWERIQVRARRHDRRRRVAVAATLAVALVGAVTLWPALRPDPGRHTTGVSVVSPSVPAPAVSHPPAGSAAWVSGGQLWLLSGSSPARSVTGSSPASDPAWSYDGQWVSYLRQLAHQTTELWVVRPDGSGNRRLWTGMIGGFSWSPAADQVAISAAPAVGVGGLTIADTDGTLRSVITDAVEVNSFSWSPDGASIAYAKVVAPASSFRSPLNILTVAGPDAGRTVTVFQASAGDGIGVAGWWRDGTGLLFYIEPHYDRSVEADGLPLMSLGLSGTTPVAAPLTLTTALVYLPWLTWAPGGQALVVSGGGRLPSENKALSLCTPSTGACTVVPTPANTVALDPAWSPDGQQIAFVVAERTGAADATWYGTRRLWVASVDDLADAHPVAGASAGAALPSWSSDGQTIRYTTTQRVEEINATGGQPQVVSGTAPLTGTPGLDGPTAYGKTGWTGHAVWAP